jgi:hypothetical protein
MKDFFTDIKAKIDAKLNDGYSIWAQYNDDRGVITFMTTILRAEVVKKDDGWHLLGYSPDGTEYCLGAAIITAVQGDTRVQIHKPEK